MWSLAANRSFRKMISSKSSPAFAEAVDEFNVSPKLPNSGVKTSLRLMPEGRTAAELDTTAADIAELCRTHGFSFCDRLHIRLRGDKRGV